MSQAFSPGEKERIRLGRENCACIALRRATRSVTRRYDEILDPCGLRATQLVILLELAYHGSATLSRLADLLVMEKSTLSRNLKPLEARGLLAFQMGEGRHKLVHLTDAGVDKLRQAIPLWIEAQNEARARADDADWDTVLDTLDALARG
ncbi:DNA-binding MarR family transcriptional regulator [Rhodothalassium salexigens DSM 2132]|uniref:DNA-binding MarR family transcriptional regulator n=1 Tax=Rhodothalassium salexigens DSM 2132 TaxID=1188247 RepID=A0A4R2PLE2_RHOSA|nr:MarR family winged helix-turn-helix transcriptional regulator [Rhodothalassium salexigens]MBB4210919.1 DNA-binding MarR family transcriptional regulator [Rhodothalassium salexigens DSM 2132]TCP36423.1 DNA-binding MarR family transcriptional regulator [Rhodothalassium salexigens DSM 2132]